ncbi:cation transporter [Tropicimonas sp.]|uniref:cation transporter n=1 Tax=Tropicimonas sp. TaxID=2067044 RepID=UPI003A8A38D9
MPCCSSDTCSSGVAATGRYRSVLWVVLGINAAMFLIEIVAGLAVGSAALQADALDFLADAANYGISLFVLGLGLRWRAGAALIKGASMGFFGLWVAGSALWHALHGTVPGWGTMGVVGSLALVANLACLALLYAWRDGDANMRSVWICSRNDSIANAAVLAATLGVFGTGTGWPDIAVATVMAALAIQGAVVIVRQALGEFRRDRRPDPVPVLR